MRQSDLATSKKQRRSTLETGVKKNKDVKARIKITENNFLT